MSNSLNVVAILCADIHLSEKPPVARSAEDDWFEAMRRQLIEVRQIAVEHSAPILCAGDLFDRHNPSPTLINFAIESLPVMYAVPGQHDLPFHNYSDIRKSAYWTLVEAGKIVHLKPYQPKDIGPLSLYSFPFGVEVKPNTRKPHLTIEIAIIHHYIWKKYAGHKGALKEDHINYWVDRLKGYDIALFGDNHLPFSAHAGDCRIYNCGSFFRRRSDEKEHKPSVGLLYSDKSIKRYYLDVSQDKFLNGADDSKPQNIELGEFMQELSTLADSAVDFRERLRRAISNEDSGVKKAVLEALEISNEQ